MELIAASEADCDRLLELVAAYREFEGQCLHGTETRAARRLYERRGFEAHDSAFMTKWVAPAGG